MNDFRQRVITPIALPFGVLAAILIYAVSMSRVFLAVPPAIAAVTAIGTAGYVLLVAFVVERRDEITSRALAVGLTIGLVAVAGAGIAAAVAGPRPVEEEPAGAAGEGGEAADVANKVDAPPADAAVFETPETDLAYEQAPDTIPAGGATIALTLTGGLEHNVVFEGVNGDQPIVDGTDGPGTYVGDVSLEPGSYTYYCSIPGHRAAGMEGTVEVQ